MKWNVAFPIVLNSFRKILSNIPSNYNMHIILNHPSTYCIIRRIITLHYEILYYYLHLFLILMFFHSLLLN